MADIFANYASSLDSPARFHYAVTPSDSVDFTVSFRSLYVGGGGTVVVVTADGTAVSYVNVASGSVLPVCGKRVNSTSTTATNIVGLY